MTVIWMGLFFLLLLGFVSLAIDMGRLRLAREQLQTAADAGARAGATALPLADGQTDAGDKVQEAYDRAEATSEANECLRVYVAGAGNGVEVVPDEDVTLGRWNRIARTFTALEDDARRGANAVRVVTRRISDRSNPINLTFAPAVGVFSKNEETVGIAMITGGPRNFGIVGIDYIDGTGNPGQVDSYDASAGPYDPNNFNHNGSVASDGDITMGNGDVYGDARPGMDDGEVTQGPNSVITGWTAPLDIILADLYPPATVPGGTPSGPPIPNQGNATMTLTGGTVGSPARYHYNSFKMKGNQILALTGPVELYVTGDVDIKGMSWSNMSANPGWLKIIVVGSGTSVDIGGTSQIAAHIYAPQSAITVHGTEDFFGAMVGKSIDMKGTADIHYDESVDPAAVPFVTVLVR